jgi:hypothetical protein
MVVTAIITAYSIQSPRGIVIPASQLSFMKLKKSCEQEEEEDDCCDNNCEHGLVPTFYNKI